MLLVFVVKIICSYDNSNSKAYLFSFGNFRFFKLIPQFGFIFLFNLILGTGALALPRAFRDAGWLITAILLAFVGFMR